MVSTLYLPESVAAQTHTVVLSCRAPTDGFAFTLQLGEEGRRASVQTDRGWDDVSVQVASQDREPETTTDERTESEQLSSEAPSATEREQTAVSSDGVGILPSVVAAGAVAAWLIWRGQDE
jgi:hypothetical protein